MTVQDDELDIPPVLRFDAIRVATLAVLALVTIAVAGLIFFLVTNVQTQRLTAECYQKSLNELNASLAVSREAARQDRANLRALITSFTNPDNTREQARAALDAYVVALDAADRDRAAAPLPTRSCD